MTDRLKKSRRGLAMWMTDPDFEDIDTGTAPPRPPIVAPRPGSGGTWPTNPTPGVIGRGGKKVPPFKKKPKKPNSWAR